MANQTQVVFFDAVNNKHAVLASGNKLDRNILDLATGAASYNPSTNDLTLTFADGTTVVVNLGVLSVDKFLASSSYDTTTNSLVLNMSDGSTYTVPLADLVPVLTGNTSTTTVTGNGTTGNAIQVDVKISANAGNLLSVAADGLFVPALDLQTTTAPASADDGTVTTKSISNSGNPAQVLLGDPAGWATIVVGGVAKRIPYWD
jgi:hypothetical protein